MAAGDNSQNHTSMVVFWNTQHTKAYLKRKLVASDKRRRREDVTLFDEWLSVLVANIYSGVPEEQEWRTRSNRQQLVKKCDVLATSPLVAGFQLSL